ncbi:MAG: sensor hybrid histidine kinase [Myxococcaceae bacterium]|nr:sensor hybrid histidine kinase [Myxococcaceae bacterium]
MWKAAAGAAEEKREIGPNTSRVRPGEHAVQFYEREETLYDAVATFLREGLNRNEPLVVIATEPRRKAFALRLEASGVDLEAAMKSGRVVMRDAAETLTTFMRDGSPDPALFRAAIGLIFEASAASTPPRPRVRAYGDMVDVLWRQDNRTGALQVERLWSELAASHDFSLLCAYVLDSFFRSSDAEYFEKICGSHDRVVPTERYLDLVDPNARLRELVRLQQRARALETEIVSREQLERELRAAALTKNQFLSTLGHELRNPLAPIVTALHLLKSRRDKGSTKELDVIERQVGRMIKLVDDLLDMTQATGKIEIQKKPVDVGDVLVRALEMTSPLFAERRHQVSLEVTCGNVHVLGDRRRLGQAVTHLLTNAAKYMDEGGRVDVRARRDGSEVMVHVRDAGVGIAPDVLPRIFEAFVPAAQHASGRVNPGLGLPIVKQIAELHGGTVAIASAGRGHGTEVTLRLPAVDGEAVYTHHPQSIEAEQRALRVLVVEDDEDAASMLADYLGWIGHTTAVANEAYGALEVVEHFRPDVALLDIELPGMDGYELARRLKEMPSPACIIAVTGFGQDADRAQSAAAGFNAHLVKPIDMSSLGPLLDALTGRTALRS